MMYSCYPGTVFVIDTDTLEISESVDISRLEVFNVSNVSKKVDDSSEEKEDDGRKTIILAAARSANIVVFIAVVPSFPSSSLHKSVTSLAILSEVHSSVSMSSRCLKYSKIACFALINDYPTLLKDFDNSVANGGSSKKSSTTANNSTAKTMATSTSPKISRTNERSSSNSTLNTIM